MIVGSACIVQDGTAYMGGHIVRITDKLLQRKFLIFRVIHKHLIQIVDIGLQIPVAMEFHGFPADKRFHGVIGIGKRRIDKRIVFVQQKTLLKLFIIHYMNKLKNRYNGSFPSVCAKISRSMQACMDQNPFYAFCLLFTYVLMASKLSLLRICSILHASSAAISGATPREVSQEVMNSCRS